VRNFLFEIENGTIVWFMLRFVAHAIDHHAGRRQLKPAREL